MLNLFSSPTGLGLLGPSLGLESQIAHMLLFVLSHSFSSVQNRQEAGSNVQQMYCLPCMVFSGQATFSKH